MELVRPEGEEWPKAEASESVGCPDTGPGLNRQKKDTAGVLRTYSGHTPCADWLSCSNELPRMS